MRRALLLPEFDFHIECFRGKYMQDVDALNHHIAVSNQTSW
jgi:hypothetical protein